MSRVFLSETDRLNYFSTLKTKSGISWIEIAKKLNVSNRQLRDWRKGIYSLPYSIVKLITEDFKVNLPVNVVIKDNYWYIKEAARMGGKRRYELYGSPGTAEGRRKGGFHSLKTHLRNNTGFIISKNILIPNRSSRLAEVIGSLLGDGGISRWQVRITLNLKTDKDYSVYIANLIQELFGITVKSYERKSDSAIELIASSNKLVGFFKKNGLPIGNKIKQGLDIPVWINNRKSWQIACLRGIFDTDGCTYIDSHIYKEKTYRHLGLAFTSYSKNMLKSIYNVLKSFGYLPTLTTSKRVLLRREKEVLKFFNEFKPSNFRHYRILNKFMEEYRSGCNGTASKAVVALRLP